MEASHAGKADRRAVQYVQCLPSAIELVLLSIVLAVFFTLPRGELPEMVCVWLRVQTAPTGIRYPCVCEDKRERAQSDDPPD